MRGVSGSKRGKQMMARNDLSTPFLLTDFTFVGGRQEDGMDGGGFDRTGGESTQPTSDQTAGGGAPDDEPPATEDDIPF